MHKKITLYEYGNGIYAKPLQMRIEEKIQKFSDNHKVVSIHKRYIEGKYLVENCFGMDVFKPIECFIDIEYEE